MQSSSALAAGRGWGDYLPITAVKEYYWCPVSAYLQLTGPRPRETWSMRAGRQRLPRERIRALLEQRGHSVREMLWEHPVASHRLGLRGRVDLAALTSRGVVIVEAKLAAPGPRGLQGRDRRLLAQLAGYAVAVEETLRLPLEAAYIYSTEDDRLTPAPITPGLRRLVEHAAKELHQALEKGTPPETGPLVRGACSTCQYRGICPRRLHA